MGLCCCKFLQKKNSISFFTREFPYTHEELQHLLDRPAIEKGAYRYSAIKTKYITFY